jgi:hypothetical protein
VLLVDVGGQGSIPLAGEVTVEAVVLVGAETKTVKLQNSYLEGSRCYVRLDFVQQFKSELVRRLEGVVFEKKKCS